MKTILLSLLTAAFVATSLTAQSLVPARINYQAFVTDNNNLPYGNTAPTNYDVTFRIYNSAATPVVVWAEKQTVTIFEGKFSVLLGNGTVDGANPRPTLDTLFGASPPTASNNQQLTIGITVNALNQTGAAEFTPRQQLVSNPLALRARSAAVADNVTGNSITNAAIADGAIGGTKITSSSITVTQLADSAVTNAKMAANAVGNAQLADLAVNTAELADNAVTNAKMANDAVGNAELADLAVNTAELRDLAVTTAKIADNAVTNARIADNAIGSAEISDGSILSADIANGTVSPQDISFGSSDANSIFFHHPTPHSSTRYPSFQIDRSTSHGGLFYFNAHPNANSNNLLQATLWFDDQTYLRLRRHNTDGGSARLDSTGNWSASSDERLKKDITPAGGLLEKALRIKPVHFHWKTQAETEPASFGVIAQEVEQVVPELVTKGDSWAVNYSGLGVVAIGAIQEQQTQLKGQTGRIESLEKENADLKARLERLEQALTTIK